MLHELVPLALLALSFSSAPSAQCITEAVASPPGWRGFATDVELSGDTVLLGAPLRSVAGVLHAGGARVYSRSATGWSLQATLNPPATVAEGRFGNEVAIEGDRAVVGAPGVGAAYVYERQGAAWALAQTLTPAQPAPQFGASVALDGARLLVGASGHCCPATGGSAHVFELAGATWSETQMLTGPIGVQFGLEVALDGPWAMVGAPDLSAVFPYELVGTQWVAKAAIENKEAAAFGIAIALDGTRALLGSLDTQNGAAAIFELGPSGWELAASLDPSEPVSQFGRATSLEGDRAVVGAGSRAYVFERSGGAWPKTAALDAGEYSLYTYGTFGHAVAQEGDRLMVGEVDAVALGGARGRVFEASFSSTDCWTFISDEPGLELGTDDIARLEFFPGPAYAGDFYFVLGSLSGLAPGISVGGAVLPLVSDPYLAFTIAKPNSPPLTSSFGILGGDGESTTLFSTASLQGMPLAGVEVTHAAVVLDATTLQIEHVSNAAGLFFY